MKKIDIEKVRRWTVGFECRETMDILPCPELVVGEMEGKGYLIPAFDVGTLPPESGGQLTLTIGGRGILKTGTTKTVLTPGSAFLYRDRDTFTHYYTDPDSDEYWRFVWINFRGKAADELIARINERYGYVFYPGVDSDLWKLLCGYEKYAGRHFVISPFEGASIVLELLQMLCSSLPGGEHTTAEPLSDKISQELNTRFGETLSSQVLAQRIGMSREHLSRTFHQETGETLRDYRARHRLQKAATLLLKSNISCKEIANLCHYGSYSSFFRAFQKYFGKSPELFRQAGGTLSSGKQSM